MIERVFEILAEGGGLKIERNRNRSGEKFIYHHNEMDLTNERHGINKKGEFENFEQPFQLINSKYPWFLLHLMTLHDDFREYVLSELIITLNKKGVKPEDLVHVKENLEKTLKTKLEFGDNQIWTAIT